MSESSLEMPRYQCHKKVWALKIQQVYSVGTQNFIVPADYGYDDFPVSQEYIVMRRAINAPIPAR